MSRMRTIPWIFCIWLIWQPIIINSQPGNTFVYAGIDWKADNLDNTMFWIGLIFVVLAGISDAAIEQKKDKRRELKYASYK